MDTRTEKIVLRWVFSILVTFIGSSLVAFATYFFLMPSTISPGGVNGFSIIINRLTGIPVSLLSLIINIPLFIFAAKLLGKRCAILTLEATLTLSLMFMLCENFFAPDLLQIQQDLMLSSVFGGLLVGLGLGFVFKVGGTTGGTDLAGAIINHKFKTFSVAQGMGVLDLVVVLLSAVVTAQIQTALYSLIALFFCMKVPDIILEGFNYYKGFMIVTNESEKIGNALMEKLYRGVTILHGAGFYSRQDKPILLCVVHRAQFSMAKEIINSYDPNAFIMIMDMKEVFGNGFLLANNKET